MGQHAIAQGQVEVLAQVIEGPVQGQVMAYGLFTVQAHRQEVEEHLRAHRPHHVHRYRSARMGWHAVAQFHGTGQVHVAPGGVFTLIAHLLQRLGLGFAGVAVVRVGEQHLIAQLRGPAVFTLGHRRLHFLKHCRFAAHGLDRTLGRFYRRQRIEVGRVTVIETHVALIHRPGVETQ
ncbi:hypothetical protein D3C72_1709340 [compost metagenome]